MNPSVYGIDCSFDELTAAEARNLYDAGVRVFIQALLAIDHTGAVKPAARVNNLQVAHAAGFAIAGYIPIAPQRPGASYVNYAREGIPDGLWALLRRSPIDVELPGLTELQVLEALARAHDLEKPMDVYTNYNTWVNVLGNPQRPAGVGLWNALWDDHPDFDFPRLHYGGWQESEVWGEQWSGGHYIAGQLADRNQFRPEAFGLHQPGPDLKQVAQLLRQVAQELEK